MRHMDLGLLHTFKTIAGCKSLSGAALRLHKTQAAISIQLKKLEDQVGKRLLERGHQVAELTPDGELLLQYAHRMLALSDEAMDLFLKEEVSGTVRFGIPDDYASAFLLPVLQEFTQRYPKVKLKIRNDISQNLFTAMENGDLDLALVTQRSGEKTGETLRCDQLQWVAAKNYQMNTAEPLPLALYPHGCGYRRQILAALSNAQRAYDITFECTGVKGVQLAVDSGMAVAATAGPLIQLGWKVLDPEFEMLPSLGNVLVEIQHGKTGVSAAVQHFADELRKLVPGR